jgi:tetratricopeptide (TPR) repeat protein
MSEHPHRDKLEGFLLSHLPSREVKTAVAHLLGGCDCCRQEMSPLATAMITPGGGPELQISAEESSAYDRSIAAAFAKALEVERRLGAEREEAVQRSAEILRTLERSETQSLPEGEITWGLCESLLEKSIAQRYTDHPGMLRLAELARMASDRLNPADYGAERKTDMQARVWAELANAYRVNDDFAQAEAAMAYALDLRTQGTGDPLLYARIAELGASLACDQRRFKEAFRLLDLAYAIHSRYSDPHEVGRIVLLKGLYTGYAGKPEEGLQLLARGLSMIDRTRDARLVFHTLHNVLLFRVELGDFVQAQRQLQRMRSLYAAHADWLNMIKLLRIEGEIAAGLGDLAAAEATLQQARKEFDEAGLGYEAALVCLDLAGIWLQQSRTAEVRSLASDVVSSFRVLGVEREALSALHLLQDALERDQATVEVLRLVSGILRRLQNERVTRAGFDSL